ncbi:hypothetical protein J7E59_004073, partial [Salmonella enterica]|nr:hypothetical protein [Salmonella enterica]
MRSWPPCFREILIMATMAELIEARAALHDLMTGKR